MPRLLGLGARGILKGKHVSDAERRKSGQRIDAGYWARLRRIMEAEPNVSKAAIAMGSDRKTIRRLWNEGVPGTAWGAVPMKDVVAQGSAAERERFAAHRAEAARRQELDERPLAPAQQAAARRDAVDTRVEEALLVRAARVNATKLLEATAQIGMGASVFAKALGELLSNDVKMKELTAHQGMLILARFAGVTRAAIINAQGVLALERLTMGDPNKRGPQGAAALAEGMSKEDAIMHLERATRILERTRRKAAAAAGESDAAAPDTTPADETKH